MSKRRTPLTRISITISTDVLKAADRMARQLDRSRSWVLGEAVRRMTREMDPTAIGEARVNPYAGYEEEMRTVRLRRLRADLASSPEQRLREAEGLLELGRTVRPARNRAQVIGFDSFEDFDRWKTTRRAGG